MAASCFYVPTKERQDGLCPRCLNPALKLFILKRLDWDGLTDLGERVACTDCRVFITPLKEYAQ